ncbi:hypothetical protein SAMN05443549_10586 [Flavobacterium fluvii]|uniref:Uncharacterized protein n=1 Tax=Flavobacterium fluvii TaxID=468056 RepID=A0A1M5L5K7_9FLAO|nr:hypothetical protein [Flavobacterium fluvii]SHG60298.1 hypothetical protein SAMN05443549_10586 [Flavobacterium fluvii]
MENLTENILVFATNIRTVTDKLTISAALDKNPAIEKWNIDQEDVDCVLRIISKTLSEEEIINIVENQNFKCASLE